MPADQGIKIFFLHFQHTPPLHRHSFKQHNLFAPFGDVITEFDCNIKKKKQGTRAETGS